MTFQILIADEKADEYAAALSDFEGPVAWQIAADSCAGVADHCQIILGSPDRVAALLGHAPHLRWVQSTWAGVDQLTHPKQRRDYVLTSAKGIFGALMTEYVLCYLLMHERQVLQRWESQRARYWDQTAPGQLRGKTLSIVGLGDIGRAIARQLQALGVRVIGVNRSGQSAEPVDCCLSMEQLSEAVSESDYVVSVLPETPQTLHLFNATLFASFKPGAYFINIGRGSAVDNQALLEVINAGRLSGAALDVFETEPLPAQSPLWITPGIQVTSHTAAPSFVEPVADLFRRNLRRFISGQALHHTVDFERGY